MTTRLTLGTIIIVLAVIHVRCRSLRRLTGDHGGGFATIASTKGSRDNGRVVVRPSLVTIGPARNAKKYAHGILSNIRFGELLSATPQQ